MNPSAPARWLARPLLGIVWIYRNAVSPMFGASCRFQPTCSAYADEALRQHGAFRGGWLMLRRIARCHPWGGSGYDPVPPGDGEPVPAKKNRDGEPIEPR